MINHASCNFSTCDVLKCSNQFSVIPFAKLPSSKRRKLPPLPLISAAVLLLLLLEAVVAAAAATELSAAAGREEYALEVTVAGTTGVGGAFNVVGVAILIEGVDGAVVC